MQQDLPLDTPQNYTCDDKACELCDDVCTLPDDDVLDAHNEEEMVDEVVPEDAVKLLTAEALVVQGAFVQKLSYFLQSTAPKLKMQTFS
jgi:hypothetical protein